MQDVYEPTQERIFQIAQIVGIKPIVLVQKIKHQKNKVDQIEVVIEETREVKLIVITVTL